MQKFTSGMGNPKKKIKADSNVSGSTSAAPDFMQFPTPHLLISAERKNVQIKRQATPPKRPTSNAQSTVPSVEKFAPTFPPLITRNEVIQARRSREIIAGFLSDWTNWRADIQRETDSAIERIPSRPSTKYDGVIRHFRIMGAHFNALVQRGKSIASAICTPEHICMFEPVQNAHVAVMNLWAFYTNNLRAGESSSIDLNLIVEGRVASLVIEVLESWSEIHGVKSLVGHRAMITSGSICLL